MIFDGSAGRKIPFANAMEHSTDSRRLFWGEFRRSFRTTGAVLPSGQRLGRALASFVSAGSRPRRILEVGPGTGAVTRQILAAMRADDRLDLVEINDRFVRHLQQQLREDPAFRTASDRVRLFQCDVAELAAEEPYDVVVSGLPLNNFSVAEVRRLIAALTSLLGPGGVLSFFEYMAIRELKRMISGRVQRDRLLGIGSELAKLLRGQEVRRDAVWLNVPPAWVHHVRVSDG